MRIRQAIEVQRFCRRIFVDGKARPWHPLILLLGFIKYLMTS